MRPAPEAGESVIGDAIYVSRSNREGTRVRSTYLFNCRRLEKHLPLRLRSRMWIKPGTRGINKTREKNVLSNHSIGCQATTTSMVGAIRERRGT
ncbi:hypothetical protein NDU88_003924 [Pleurodeles waltl]|uniref:Uncharacterized protein n=1 Tax=Pleurodeles waltl TaxID=8319 RepID=A0AAV7REI2_PLEWA|nr:hypothetical protein NDU88_003924 [Pleurodeles waltl]